MSRYLFSIAAWLLPGVLLAGLAGYALFLRAHAERKRLRQERSSLLDELESYTHTVGHDLRTPLSSIVGYGSMVREMHRGMKAEEIEARMDDIIRLSFRASSMLDELLLLSTVRTASAVPLEPLDTAAIVRRARDRLKTLIADSAAEILVPQDWPAASGYAPWVEEVWTQYLSNGLRYGGQPPRLELGGAQQADGTRFWVRDNGPGLSDEQGQRLFLPFARLHSSRTRGHGLGLTVVQRILEKLGGAAGVESQPGQGSTFYFVLPRR
jgi:signal transduction histidine kinase